MTKHLIETLVAFEAYVDGRVLDDALGLLPYDDSEEAKDRSTWQGLITRIDPTIEPWEFDE